MDFGPRSVERLCGSALPFGVLEASERGFRDALDNCVDDHADGGGLVVVVDADPFATTRALWAYLPDAPLPDTPWIWPYLPGEPAMLEPGTYLLQVWLGQSVSAGGPLRGCEKVFTVRQDEGVSITVSGIPPLTQEPAAPLVECPTG